MALQTQYLLQGHYAFFSAPALFLFFGTLFIYSAHRLYSLSKNGAASGYPYDKFRSLLWANTSIGAVASVVCWYYLPGAARWQTLVPCALALAYILPVLPAKKRLRDVATLKIFLLSGCWSWLTVILPASAAGMGWSAVAFVMAIGRAAFIFALCIGFDIRDQQRDKEAGVNTLPVKFGERTAIAFAFMALLLSVFISILFTSASIYLESAAYSMAISGVMALVLVAGSGQKNRNLFYFLFGVDGMMILQFLLVLC